MTFLKFLWSKFNSLNKFVRWGIIIAVLMVIGNMGDKDKAAQKKVAPSAPAKVEKQLTKEEQAALEAKKKAEAEKKKLETFKDDLKIAAKHVAEEYLPKGTDIPYLTTDFRAIKYDDNTWGVKLPVEYKGKYHKIQVRFSGDGKTVKSLIAGGQERPINRSTIRIVGYDIFDHK